MQLGGNFSLFWKMLIFFRKHPHSCLACLSSWYMLLKKAFQGHFSSNIFQRLYVMAFCSYTVSTSLAGVKTFTSFLEHVSYFPQHLCANGTSISDTRYPKGWRGYRTCLRSSREFPAEHRDGGFLVSSFLFQLPNLRPLRVPCVMPWWNAYEKAMCLKHGFLGSLAE